MPGLIRDGWPMLGLIAIGVVFITGAELFDYVSPGNGWAIMAYLVPIGSVLVVGGCLVAHHLRNRRGR